MDAEVVLYLVNPGPRPAYHKIADHLWGPGADIDSDGNSKTSEDETWTELTLMLRAGSNDQTVNVDPVSESPLVLAVRSPSKLLAKKTVEFLSSFTGGQIRATVPKPLGPMR